MLSFLLFVFVIVLWISLGNERKRFSQEVDYDSASYRKGFEDGKIAAKDGKLPEKEIPKLDQSSQELGVNLKNLEMAEKVSADTPNFEFTSLPPEDEQKHKEKINKQNINVALYVASLLLVGGVAIFAQVADLPDVTKFIIVWLIIISYYITGFVLLEKVPIIKPAAVAFVGTALAILPLTGPLMYNLIVADSALCWVITSLIALVAYFYATVKFESRILAFITVASFISLSNATISTLGIGIMWYSITTIIVGAIFTIISRLSIKVIPEIFSKPIMISGQWLVPFSIFLSLVNIPSMNLSDFVVVFAVSALFYVANAETLKVGSNERSISWFLARSFLSISILCFSYDIFGSWEVFAHTLVAVGLLQSIISIISIPVGSRSANNQHEAWLWIGLMMAILAPLVLPKDINWDNFTAAYYSFVAVFCVLSSLYKKRPELNGVTLFCSVVLPALVCMYVVYPPLGQEVLAITYCTLMLLMFACRVLLKNREISKISYSLLTLSIFTFMFFSIITAASLDVAWQLIILFSSSLVFYAYVWLEGKVSMIVFGNILTFIAFMDLGNLFEFEFADSASLVSWLSLVVFFGTGLACRSLQKFGDQIYKYMWVSASIFATLAGLIAVLAYGNDVSSVFACFALFGVGGILLYQYSQENKYGYIDIAFLLINIGLVKIASIITPDIGGLFYAHWWALLVGCLAYIYYNAGKKDVAQRRLVLALSILSLCSLKYALSEESASYQLLFLVEQSIMVIAGLIASYRLLTVWGGVGVSLALLWMLKDLSSPLLISLIGLAIIFGVVYVIVKGEKRKQ